MANMTGNDLYTAVTQLLSGFQMDSVLFYQMLETARQRRESMRPFKVFEKLDVSQTANAQNQPLLLNTNPKTLPSDFKYLREDGYIVLYDNNNTWLEYYEIPFSQAIQYLQNSNKFYINYSNNTYCLCGIVDRTYTINFFYQADLGAITSTSTWTNVPSRYHMILAYDVAVMYRLGVDYDDINARNADENNRNADMLFDAMCKWDDSLARSSVTTMDRPSYGTNNEGNGGFTNRKINIGL